MIGKLPIGIQGFEGLRKDGYLYVDKTAYIYKLAHEGKPYFLSRPRRFGKSLLLSSLRLYWEGRKDLFEGLEIVRLERDNPNAWEVHPVFYFDFSGWNYHEANAFESALDAHLRAWERQYGDEYAARSLEERFQMLLETAHEQTGKRCVVLIDEYDKPLLDIMDDAKQLRHNKDLFKGFFSSLKKEDEHLRFVFITGVTKFHKVSIFSDLNQLLDISLMKEYSAICGITEQEMRDVFADHIKEFANEQGISREQCIAELRKMYDGYLFHPEGTKVYNPFSLLKAFYENNFGAFWFETGTPVFLTEKVRKSGMDVRKFSDRTLYASAGMLSDYTEDNPDLIPLLYQTGYLTIADYDSRRRRYTLGFPNEEVKYGFLEGLLPAIAPQNTGGTGNDIFTLDAYIESGDTEGVRKVLVSLFAGIPYTNKSIPFEHDFQTVIYLVFTLLGKFTLCEMHTFNGRIDCKVETDDYIYLFEFKRDESAEAALAQIDSKEYALPFEADFRTLIKIGVNFDSESRMLTGWKVE